jgi:GH18 family chitinase
MSIGGADAATNRVAFSTIAASSSRRASFANHILRALRLNGYDGVDIDYEFPANPTERMEFTLLMKEIHHCLKTANQDYIVMFGCGTGFYFDQMDWKRLARYTDFACCFGYDWRNPANGPISNPGVTQWLSGGTDRIEASVKGAVDYILGRGFPSEKLLVGLPFYGSNGNSWFTIRDSWATNQAALAAQAHPDWFEVKIGDAWWTTPEALGKKMSALLLPGDSVLTNSTTVRGIGFWEFGHERHTHPDLSSAIVRWISTNAPSLTQPTVAPRKLTNL